MATAKKKTARRKKSAAPVKRVKKSPRSKAAKHLRMAREQYEIELGKFATQKLLARTKTEKKKLQKKIAEVSSRIRKLSH